MSDWLTLGKCWRHGWRQQGTYLLLLVSKLLVTQEGLGLLRENTCKVIPPCQISFGEALLEEAGDREKKQSSKSDLILPSLILLSAVLFFFSFFLGDICWFPANISLLERQSKSLPLAICLGLSHMASSLL